MLFIFMRSEVLLFRGLYCAPQDLSRSDQKLPDLNRSDQNISHQFTSYCQPNCSELTDLIRSADSKSKQILLRSVQICSDLFRSAQICSDLLRSAQICSDLSDSDQILSRSLSSLFVFIMSIL